MSHSPRKLVSNFTVNKGVEARELQIEYPRFAATTRTDADAAACSGGGERGAAGEERGASEHSASFVQVLVRKLRPPAASSPAPPQRSPAPPQRSRGPHAPDAPRAAPPPVAVVVAWPARAAPQPWGHGRARRAEPSPAPRPASGERCSGGGGGGGGGGGDAQKPSKKSVWNKMCRLKSQDLDFERATRIEVHRFERGAALLCARGGAASSRVERWARRAARPADALLAELLGALRVLVAAPLHVALRLERCAAASAMAAAGGALAGVTEPLLKPLLAQTFNALVRPPLLLAGAACAALREAARPAALLLGDALEAAARPLAALRLVHVERHCAAQRV